MRVAICEDHPETLELLLQSVEESGVSGLEADPFGSGEALLRLLDTSEEAYHIYLLDIEMPGRNGIETASAIRRRDRDAVLIFVTDHKEYVYEIFEVLPFRFLGKPVDASAVARALQDAKDHLQAAGKLFFYHVGREQRQLPCGQIRYFEGAGRKVLIHTGREIISYYGKISDVPAQVDSARFCRIHASFVINLESVRAVRQEEVLLEGGEMLPVSRKQRAVLRQAHLAFMQRRGGMASW